MSPKKTVKIEDESFTYSFQVNLETKRIELILREGISTISSIIGMNLVPDEVQIKLYKALAQLSNEYKASRK